MITIIAIISNWVVFGDVFREGSGIGVVKDLFNYVPNRRGGRHTGFGDSDLIFKITAGLKLPNLHQKVIVCMLHLSHEPLAGMLPNLHVYIIGTGSKADEIW